MRPKAILFDLDGVIYDSLPNWVIAWQKGFAPIGFDLDAKEVYLEEGRQAQDTIEVVCQKYGLDIPSPEKIAEMIELRNRVYKEQGKPPLIKGVAELIQAIQQKSIPLYIVTGSSNDELYSDLKEDFNIDRENVVSGNDVVKGKPDPESYLKACKKAKVGAKDALVIENAPLGVKSAVEAGCECTAINTGPLKKEDLLSAGAKEIFNSHLEIKHYLGL